MVTRQIQSGDAQLYVEAIGEARNPCVILVMGAQASLTWWPGEFCETLAARGRYVLRFDNRDTGLSTKYPVGAPGYSLDDMADDVIAILDGFGVAKAQLVGVSMGGMIGQIAGLKYPARFTQLAIVSSTPLDGAQRHLPGPTKAFMAATARGEKVDWNNREQATKALLQFGRVLAADEKHFDESGARAVIEADFDRSGGLAHSTNHFQLKGGESWSAHLAGLQPPLVVLHGRLDPLFPIEHGRALAKAVKGATFVELPGGHGLDRAAWEPLIDALISRP
jgi:pimeloyl-ACP methyl ester carboxylesterase